MNGKTTIKQIPLNAQLNTTKNKTRVSTDFDQLNDINSPVFGGNISPLHIKKYADDKKILFDKKSNDYYFENGHLKSNSLKLDLDLSENVYFETGDFADDYDEIVYGKCPIEYEDGNTVIRDNTTTKKYGKTINIGVAHKLDNNGVVHFSYDYSGNNNFKEFGTISPRTIKKYTGDADNNTYEDNGYFIPIKCRVVFPFQDIENSFSNFITTGLYADYTETSTNIKGQEFIGNALAFVVFQNTEFNEETVDNALTQRKYKYVIGCYHLIFQKGNEGNYRALGTVDPTISWPEFKALDFYKLTNLNVSSMEAYGKALDYKTTGTNDYDIQMIISAQNFGKAALKSDVMGCCYGITLLNKKQSGSNARTDLTFWNGVYFEQDSLYYKIFEKHSYWNEYTDYYYNTRVPNYSPSFSLRSFSCWLDAYEAGDYICTDDESDFCHVIWTPYPVYLNPGHYINSTFYKSHDCLDTITGTSTAVTHTKTSVDSSSCNGVFEEGTNHIIGLLPYTNNNSVTNTYQAILGTIERGDLILDYKSDPYTPLPPWKPVNMLNGVFTSDASIVICSQVPKTGGYAFQVYPYYNMQIVRGTYSGDTLTYLNHYRSPFGRLLLGDEQPYPYDEVATDTGNIVPGERVSNCYKTSTNGISISVGSFTYYNYTFNSVNIGSLEKTFCFNANAKDGDYVAWSTNSEVYGAPSSTDSWTVTTNQGYTRIVIAGKNGTNSDYAKDVNGGCILWDSAIPNRVFSGVGMQSSVSIPTTADSWTEFFESTKNNSSYSIYNSIGSLVYVKKQDNSESKFRILINYKDGFISGISYGNKGSIGKLLTEWDSVDEGFNIKTVDDNTVIYKDNYYNRVKYIRAKPFSELSDNEAIEKIQIVFDRYIFINTDKELNCYDFINKEWESWGSDWNNRILNGFTYSQQLPEMFESTTNRTVNNWTTVVWKNGLTGYKNNWYQTGSAGSGQFVNYSAVDAFAPSRQLPYNSFSRVINGHEYIIAGDSEVGVEYFFSGNKSSTSTIIPSYYCTFRTGENNGNIFNYNYYDNKLEGMVYPIAPSGTILNNFPVVGVDFVTSYNGKYGIKLDNTLYTITYDGIKPIGLYNTTSLVENADVFFIVQGQYYAVINDYICSISYNSSNVINSVEQLVNINGMKYIGAFPSVAYFWSEANKALYAFTGDADLQLFVQTDRINTVYNYLYSPSKEWIYLATDDGLYVFTQSNVFRIKQFTNVNQLYETDRPYDVLVDDGNTYFLSLTPQEGYDTIPIEIETEFFGPGNFGTAIIDCWLIRLYKGDEDYNNKIEYTVTTLTDKVKTVESKSIKLKESDFDENDNAFIRLQPAGMRGEGVSLKLKSYYPISMIGVSMTNDAQNHSRINL